MACYAYSVLTRWFSSVYSGAGSRPSSDQMAKQELQWIQRTGVYALMDERILRSRVTRL